MKKLLYALAGTCLLAQNNVTNAFTFGENRATDLTNDTRGVDAVIVTLITTLASFAALVAVLYAIFGGFTILTAAGDEKKVKKGRTIIFQAILGLVVIYLAYSIIFWIITVLFQGGA